jgi:hypothetical protein
MCGAQHCRRNVGRARRARYRMLDQAARRSRGARAPQKTSTRSLMWGATAGRAVRGIGEDGRRSRGARAPQKPVSEVSRGARPPGAQTGARLCWETLARRASPTKNQHAKSHVGRARRARNPMLGQAARRSRGARAPQKTSTRSLTWGAHAVRANRRSIELQDAQAAREPHKNQQAKSHVGRAGLHDGWGTGGVYNAAPAPVRRAVFGSVWVWRSSCAASSASSTRASAPWARS